jgi:RNA polymerase sigma factor (sigma-70 family)
MSRIDRAFARYCQTRDPQALARVFDAVAPDLLRLARHLAPQAAEDVLQDTFLTAIERADTFATERRVLPWLFGILVHRARMQRRIAARARPEDGAGDATAIDRAPAPPTLAEHREAEHHLRDAVAALPARYRELMVPTLEEGLTPAELAERLQRNPSTVRTQFARGLEELQRRLPALAVGALAVAPGANAALLLRMREHIVPGIAAAKRALHLGWLAAAVVCISAGLAALWPATPEPAVAHVVAEAPAIDAPAPAAPLERAAAAPVDPSDAPRATNSSTIEVRGRCVDAASATPLADCAVELKSRSRNELMDLLFGPFANAQATTRTGSDGTFTLRIDDHPGTDHAIDVRASGRALYRCRVGPDLAGTRPRGPIELGDLRLEAGVELVGRVTDPDGRPFERVFVAFWWRTHEPPFQELCSASFTADAQGRWIATHGASVPARTYRAAFGAVLGDSYMVNFGGAPAVLGPTTGPDTRLVNGHVTLDLVLPRPVEIKGRIVDGAGSPLLGVQVVARTREGAQRLMFARARSRADGTFTLVAPVETPGPVELIADAPCELLEPGPTVAWGSSDHVLRARCTPRTGATGVAVELRVTDAVSGQPVERFGYRLDPPQTASRQARDSRLHGIGDHTGGVLRVDTIPAGDYSLELVPSHRHEPLRREVTVPPTGAVLDFAVVPATHRELAVLVRDSLGQPVRGAEVELLEPLPGHTIEVHTPALPRYATGSGPRALQRGKGVTDGEGRGTLDVRIVQGVETFAVRVRSATHPPLLLPGVRLPAPGAALAIDVPAGASLLARLDPPTLMLLAPHLRVLDADGRSLAKAGGANGNGALPFAADGTLRVDGLAPGHVVLELVTVTQSGPFVIPQRLAVLQPVEVRAARRLRHGDALQAAHPRGARLLASSCLRGRQASPAPAASAASPSPPPRAARRLRRRACGRPVTQAWRARRSRRRPACRVRRSAARRPGTARRRARSLRRIPPAPPRAARARPPTACRRRDRRARSRAPRGAPRCAPPAPTRRG